MEITVSGRRQPATESLKVYAEEKLTKACSKYHKLTNAHVILDQERERHMAEVTLTGKHVNLVAKAHSEESIFIALDEAVDKLETQLHKHNDKILDSRLRVDKEKLHEMEVEETAV